MTAAANTGPAKHPRPASSHPASMAVSSKNGDNMGDPMVFFSFKLLTFGSLILMPLHNFRKNLMAEYTFALSKTTFLFVNIVY